MWTDPENMLATARERQRDIACEFAAGRTKAKPGPALDDVTRSWLTAVQTTRDYVRSLVVG